MNVFELRDKIIAEDYARYTRSFIEIADKRIQEETDARLAAGCLWPEPLLQLNPSYEYSAHISDLVRDGLLHPDCSRFFVSKGKETHLYRHQEQAIKKALNGHNYILTSGTGSGKSLSYVIPIVNSLLNAEPKSGIQAILVYPMNALVNSQKEDLDKFFAGRDAPFSYAIYTGQEDGKKREGMIQNPPHILLTNYMMLELLLTRKHETQLARAMKNLEFLVLDELHTYRGRKGADVSLLVRRLRQASGRDFQCIGTSATLAGGDSRLEQLEAVAEIGGTIFGVNFQASDVIVETLHSPAARVDGADPAFRRKLNSWIESGARLPESREEFFRNPLVAWLNGAIGVAPKDGELIRCKPRPLTGRNGVADELAQMCGKPEDFCANLIRQALLAGEMRLEEAADNQGAPESKFVPFLPFRLHQFVSTGDTVFCTLESPDTRYITLNGQRFAPGRDDRIPLYRLQFCRECGKEFYAVTLREEDNEISFEPREEQFGAPPALEQDGRGFLFLAGEEDAWPDTEEEILERIPEAWIEEKKGERRVVTAKKKLLPRRYFVAPDGTATEDAREGAIKAWFMPGKFQFCPACQVSYDARIGELAKLSTLGTAGRSTSNSVLAMSVINHLGKTDEPPKLLCFSDNRQDASLQAGNFNDFAETGLARSALYHALKAAGDAGISHDRLGDSILAALDACQPGGKFPTRLYMKSPEAQSYAARDARRAFADLLEYYVYADLERGWKLVSPNLEKCGLLRFEYRALPEICADDGLWRKSALLSRAGVELRLRFSTELLDYLRGRLVLDAQFLNRDEHPSLARRTAANLRAPWVIEEKGHHSYARKLLRHDAVKRDEGALRLTPLSKAGLWLKRNISEATLAERAEALQVIGEVFESQGIFTSVKSGKDSAWQIRHDCLTWKIGDGSKSAPRPMSLLRTSIAPREPNVFFLDFYRTAASAERLLHSEPHTAQVSTADREDREQRFRTGSLPVLFCSPTMELGINIEDLCVTGMRNVPPTPANYAQRSGRAGRHGQAALVLTYCAKGSPHDQHFFRRPESMVAGIVSTPQIDLANEDLIRAHIHAIWLTCSGLDLGSRLKEIIDIDDLDRLPLQPGVIEDLNNPETMKKARVAALAVLESLEAPLAKSSWYSPDWLDDTLNALPESFNSACDRWRELFRDARLQQKKLHETMENLNLPPKERDEARKSHSYVTEAIKTLINESLDRAYSDFYPYRYFASEGFLPGYNFPRLPLRAQIRSKRDGAMEYLQRERFLALSEFGPGSLIYHEGAKFKVVGVKNMGRDDREPPFAKFKICANCGWLETDAAFDLCTRCGEKLPPAYQNLLKMPDADTYRVERINSGDEVRRREGFELLRAFRHEGKERPKIAQTMDASGKPVARLEYYQAASQYLFNLGRKHNSGSCKRGFNIDTTNGRWEDGASSSKKAEAGFPKIRAVIPFVTANRNCLRFTPQEKLEKATLLSLKEALKLGIQQCYQLEDDELSATPLPSTGEPASILFVEESEGGAGVLRNLAEDPNALGKVAALALDICHFDESGIDHESAPGASEKCVAACYDCLMSYYNQPIHDSLDRHLIRDILLALKDAKTELPEDEPDKLDRLLRACESPLEREWLKYLDAKNLRLPDEAQMTIYECQTRPDFYYINPPVAIYIDGHWHDYPNRRKRDEEQMTCLKNRGIRVLRFTGESQWGETIRENGKLFGL